jgi:hypothetical protein
VSVRAHSACDDLHIGGLDAQFFLEPADHLVELLGGADGGSQLVVDRPGEVLEQYGPRDRDRGPLEFAVVRAGA